MSFGVSWVFGLVLMFTIGKLRDRDPRVDGRCVLSFRWSEVLQRTKLKGEGSWDMCYLEYAFGCLSLYTIPIWYPGTQVLKHISESQK